jgi:hypothetical protein
MTTDLKSVWVTNAAKSEIESGEVRFINGIDGSPKASETYTSAQLSKMGMVGIYKREGDENFQTISKQTERLTPGYGR